MRVGDKSYQTLWIQPENDRVISVIDQRFLPFEFRVEDLHTPAEAFTAIRDMHVRGAPLIGVTAAAGMYLALFHLPDEKEITAWLEEQALYLKSARPTAVNLSMAVDRQLRKILLSPTIEEMRAASREDLLAFIAEEVDNCRKIGEFGLPLIEEISRRKKGNPVNILTHCNAGWLACIDYGTATAPIYMAHDAGIPVHVWVSETRPRNQGFRLTAWELKQHGVPYTLVTDNACGHLLQKGMADMVITGTDRTTLNGDVANKIGTYLKAIAAKANGVPFYVAVPSTSIDWTMDDGAAIPIEERSENEVRFADGFANGKAQAVRLAPLHSPVFNPAFDVTPGRLITGLITERGICKAERDDLLRLFPGKVPYIKEM